MFILFLHEEPAVDSVSGKPYGAASQEQAQDFLEGYILPRLHKARRPGGPSYGYTIREAPELGVDDVKILEAHRG